MKRTLFGLVILIVTWELLSYTLSDFFFPGKVSKTVTVFVGGYPGRQDQLVDTFNVELFQALNIVGLALLLILIGYVLFRGSPGSKINRAVDGSQNS